MFLKKKLFSVYSFKTRLALLNTLTLILALFISFGVLFYAFQKVIQHEINDSLLNEATLVARIIDEDNNEFKISKNSRMPMKRTDLEEDLQGISKTVFVQQEGNKQIYRSKETKNISWDELQPFFKECDDNDFAFKDYYSNDKLKQAYRFIHYRYVDKERRVYLIAIGKSLKNVLWASKRFFIILAVLVPLICLGSSIAVYFICKKGLKPLDWIIELAEKIKKENISLIPSQERAPKEIARLTRALNRMLSRLKITFEREKEFSAAASHELRTPLTVLKGEIEVALTKQRSEAEYEELLAANLEEVNRLISIIDNLLLLARLEEAEFDSSKSEMVDVGELLKEIHEYANALAEKQNVKVNVKLNGETSVRILGRQKLLTQALYNLVLNSLRHSGGDELSLEASQTENEVRVSLKDNGIGIPEKDLPFLFDRFYRADKSRSSTGHGLGLSIVKAIVASHGGKIEVQSQRGEGTIFTLVFPTFNNSLN